MIIKPQKILFTKINLFNFKQNCVINNLYLILKFADNYGVYE
jgi:hypothetical protein